jgi:2-haloalkanoic acid dehalogenase type II
MSGPTRWTGYSLVRYATGSPERRAASGTYSPFREVADGALATVAPVLTARQRMEVLAAFARLDSQSDARPALERLDRAGVPVAALTNGAAATTTVLLERNGLDALVERVISIDEVRTWKPAPELYRHAADLMGVEPRRLAHVAVHGWDVHGAHHAGLVTGWASRLAGAFPAIYDPPDGPLGGARALRRRSRVGRYGRARSDRRHDRRHPRHDRNQCPRQRRRRGARQQGRSELLDAAEHARRRIVGVALDGLRAPAPAPLPDPAPGWELLAKRWRPIGASTS